MRVFLPIALGLILLISSRSWARDSTEIKKHIQTVEKKYHIPKNLLYAIVDQESGFRTKAIYRGSHGLGQLKTQTAKNHCNVKKRSQLYDYKQNLECAAIFFKYQLERYENDTYYAIAAYNAGTPFICNGSQYSRDLGRSVEKLGSCKKQQRGLVANQKYVIKVIDKWRAKNKQDERQQRRKEDLNS